MLGFSGSELRNEVKESDEEQSTVDVIDPASLTSEPTIGTDVPKKRRGRQPGTRNKPREDQPLGTVRVAELGRGISRGANAIATLFRSAAHFEENEFHGMATDIVDLVNRVPPLQIAFKVLNPLFSLAQLVDVYRRIRESRQRPPQP